MKSTDHGHKVSISDMIVVAGAEQIETEIDH